MQASGAAIQSILLCFLFEEASMISMAPNRLRKQHSSAYTAPTIVDTFRKDCWDACCEAVWSQNPGLAHCHAWRSSHKQHNARLSWCRVGVYQRTMAKRGNLQRQQQQQQWQPGLCAYLTVGQGSACGCPSWSPWAACQPSSDQSSCCQPTSCS